MQGAVVEGVVVTIVVKHGQIHAVWVHVTRYIMICCQVDTFTRVHTHMRICTTNAYVHDIV